LGTSVCGLGMIRRVLSLPSIMCFHMEILMMHSAVVLYRVA
jgi:hypothetical protein